jgi:hypothetical protein
MAFWMGQIIEELKHDQSAAHSKNMCIEVISAQTHLFFMIYAGRTRDVKEEIFSHPTTNAI